MSIYRTVSIGVAFVLASCFTPSSQAQIDLPAQIISTTVDAFIYESVDDLWSWGIAGGSASPVDIVGKLDDIETTLKDIDKELNTLIQDLKGLQCSIDADFIDKYAGGIESSYNMYKQFVADMNLGSTVDPSDLSEWANCAVGLPSAGQSCPDGSVYNLLQTLYLTAVASGGSGGAIADCVQASATPVQPGSLDDRPWYADNVEPITAWYMMVNAQALYVLTEAWHYRAWKAAGSPALQDPTSVFKTVCPSNAANPPAACVDPLTYYELTFYPNLKDQVRAGGAPYSTDQFVMVNGQNYLAARSIEAYNQAADPGNTHGCASTTPGALTSASPCGPTVGYYNDAFPSAAYGPYGYGAPDANGKANGTWVASPAATFQDVFTLGFNDTGTPAGSGVTASRFLCTQSVSGGDTTKCQQSNSGPAGLFLGNKIVQFSDLETTATWVLFNIYHPLIKFVDGNFLNGDYDQPFLGNYYSQLLETYGERCSPPTNGRIYYHNQPVGRSSDQDWYAFSLCYDPNVPANQDWMVKPNFDPRNGARQYRWPALDWTQLTCSDGSSAGKAIIEAGMPTLCGADFDTWFAASYPPSPPTATLSASADTTLHSAAPNSNDGAGFFLSLNANPPRGQHRRVALGFDPDALRALLADRDVLGVYLKVTPLPLVERYEDLWQAWNATGTNALRISAHPLHLDLVEGDGDLANSDVGIGSGATWNCAEEADPSNALRECAQKWPNPPIERGAEVIAEQEWNRETALMWEVTRAVQEGVSTWMLRLHNGIPFADVDGQPEALYYSREAAEELGEPDLAPQLLILYND